jgi:hypothetical protein
VSKRRRVVVTPQSDRSDLFAKNPAVVQNRSTSEATSAGRSGRYGRIKADDRIIDRVWLMEISSELRGDSESVVDANFFERAAIPGSPAHDVARSGQFYRAFPLRDAFDASSSRSTSEKWPPSRFRNQFGVV